MFAIVADRWDFLIYRFSLKNFSIAVALASSSPPSTVTVMVSPCLIPNPMTAISFVAAEAGDKTVLALLDAWTDEIAQGLAGMVHIFNPQLILIGGGVSAQQKLLIDPIAAKVKASVMPAFAEGLEIRAAQLHNDAGMVGAVYYFRQTMEKE